MQCHSCYQCGKNLNSGEQIIVDETRRIVSCAFHAQEQIKENKELNNDFNQISNNVEESNDFLKYLQYDECDSTFIYNTINNFSNQCIYSF